MTTTLNVGNVAQAMIFDTELRGQISDGKWENARPNHHYRDWCRCDVTCDPTKPIGRDFYPTKDTYNFTAPDLLEVVGDRMLRKARLALTVGLKAAREIEDLMDLEGRLDTPTYEGKYWDEKRAKLAQVPLLDEIRTALEDETLYSSRDLRRDLTSLKRAIKTDVRYQRASA